MATAVEFSSDTTPEDIQVAVDNAIEQVEEDRAGEATDAEKIASDTDETLGERLDETADGDSGSETADSEKAEGDETGTKDVETAEWLDDDLKAEVAAYGISEEELADFTSREELERALRFFDRSALDAGRKATAKGDKDEKSEPKDDAKKADGQKADGQVADGRYEVTLDTDVYEEDLIGEFTRMRDHYESRVAALETRFTEADTRADEQRFDGLVDSLGHADLFGKSGKETDKELERRQDLFVAVKAQQLGLNQLGRDVDLNESLVNRVARMVFTDELGKKELKARTRKVSRQSKGRMGGGATRPNDAPETLRDEARRLYKELDSA